MSYCLHFCSPKSFRNSAIFFIPWETISMNSLFSQSCWICCWTSELILRLRIGKIQLVFFRNTQECERSERLTPPGSTISGRYFHLKRMSISILVPSFFAKNKHGRRSQFFYVHVEERLPIRSPGPSVHLIGKCLCLKLHVYTRYHCIHETLSLNNFPALWFDFATAR